MGPHLATTKDRALIAKEKLRRAVDRRGSKPVKRLPGLNQSRHVEQALQLMALKRTIRFATKVITTIGPGKLAVAIPVGLAALPYVKRRIRNGVKGEKATRRRRK